MTDFALYIGFMGLAACGYDGEEDAGNADLPLDACKYRFESHAARASSDGTATLLYECSSEGCSGREAFAQGTAHAISLELRAEPDQQFTLRSNAPLVADVADIASSYDPCAERMKLWATLHANAAGSASLVVEGNEGILDSVEIAVEAPASIALKTTTLSDFAFRTEPSALLVAQGESVIVLPELRDARGKLLVGAPTLSWSIDDPSVATVRESAESDDEAYVLSRAPNPAVFVDTHEIGETHVRVRAPNGAVGALALEVIEPE